MPSVLSRRTRVWVERILDAIESDVENLPAIPETLDQRAAWSSVANSSRRLLRTADKIMATDSKSAEFIIHDLAQILSGFLEGSRFLIGAHLQISSPSHQAASARRSLETKRSLDPQVQAFHRAVDEALVGKTREQMASRSFVGMVRGTVNRSLSAAGFAEESSHSVRRRINKLRALKSAQ